MLDNALYFPAMTAPRSAWFMRSVLYWDQVGLIRPGDAPDDPHTRALIDASLVEHVEPAEYALYGDVDPLIERLDALELPAPSTRATFRTGVIHEEKFNLTALDALQARGLARRGRGPWIEVEATAAALYMAYLAALICARKGRTRPITDRQGFVLPREDDGWARSRSEVEVLVLESILPSPVGEITAADIARFKDRERESLRRMRRTVDARVIDVLGLPEEMREERVELLVAELADDVAHIQEAMRRRGWRARRWSLVALLAGVGQAGAGVLTGPWPVAALGVMAAAGAVGVEVGARRRRDGVASPMAYAALASAALT